MEKNTIASNDEKTVKVQKKKRAAYGSRSKIWIDSKTNKPGNFYLVMVKDKYDKQQITWWTGVSWDRSKEKGVGRIVAWRKLNKYDPAENPESTTLNPGFKMK